MKCPKAYADKLEALLDAGIISRRSKGRQEPVPYRCHRCKAWHLEEGK